MKFPQIWKRSNPGGRDYRNLDGSYPGSTGLHRILTTPAVIVNTALAFAFVAVDVTVGKSEHITTPLFQHAANMINMNIENPITNFLIETAGELVFSSFQTGIALALVRSFIPIAKDSLIDRSKHFTIDMAAGLKMMNYYKESGHNLFRVFMVSSAGSLMLMLSEPKNNVSTILRAERTSLCGFIMAGMCFYAANKLKKRDWSIHGSLNKTIDYGPPPEDNTTSTHHARRGFFARSAQVLSRAEA